MSRWCPPPRRNCSLSADPLTAFASPTSRATGTSWCTMGWHPCLLDVRPLPGRIPRRARHPNPAFSGGSSWLLCERRPGSGAAVYILTPADLYDHEPMVPATPAELLALSRPPNGLCFAHLEGDGHFLVHYGLAPLPSRCTAAAWSHPATRQTPQPGVFWRIFMAFVRAPAWLGHRRNRGRGGSAGGRCRGRRAAAATCSRG